MEKNLIISHLQNNYFLFILIICEIKRNNMYYIYINFVYYFVYYFIIICTHIVTLFSNKFILTI